MASMEFKLQDVEFINNFEDTKEMYFRSNSSVRKNKDEQVILEKNSYYDFFTYFNAISIVKWKKYTYVDTLYFKLIIKGKFAIDFFGHYCEKDGRTKKEFLCSYEYSFDDFEEVIIPITPIMASVVGFQITTKNKILIKDASYITYLDEKYINPKIISLVTTTFKKEEYVKRNYKVLINDVFSNEEINSKINWFIVDNGKTLDITDFSDEHVCIIPNKNVGGAGGFTRGMIEALHMSEIPDYILLTDDDVLYTASSFLRLFRFTSVLKSEYDRAFVAGAMIELENMHIQHEDVGRLSLKGEHGPIKPRFDLRYYDSIVKNEELFDDYDHVCSGWWFCCIPTSVAQLDNLPLPLFIRGDDTEYSFRNAEEIISMNGICIWHQGFGIKFSAAMEYYQVHRNDLIGCAMNEELSDVDILSRMDELFWQAIYRYDYKGAELLLDAIDDYLKGPEYVFSLDGEKTMKMMKDKDNVSQRMTSDIDRLINWEELYVWRPLSKVKKFIYDYSLNGHRMPSFLMNNEVGILPYGWGYYQNKNYLHKVIYAVDGNNHEYVKWEIDRNEYRRLKQRKKTIELELKERKRTVDIQYKEFSKKVESELFWKEYLN